MTNVKNSKRQSKDKLEVARNAKKKKSDEATLNAKQTELDVRQAELDTKKAELDAKKAELDVKKAELDAKKAELDARQAELDTKKAELVAKKAKLDAKKAELNAKKAELDARQAELDTKKAEMESKNAELVAKNVELVAKNVELVAKNVELDTKQAAMESKNAELVAKNVELVAKNVELEKTIIKLTMSINKNEDLKKKRKRETVSLNRKCEALRAERKHLCQRIYLLKRSRVRWKIKRGPTKKLARKPRKTIMSAEQDLRFTLKFNITENKRKAMKSYMRELKIDFFATNRERKVLLEQISPMNHWIYEKIIENRGVLYRADIEEELRNRLTRLQESKKFKINENAECLYLCIVGDKGSNWTKIGMFFINVLKANDPANISMLCLYQGKDSSGELRLFGYNVFAQLNPLYGRRFRVQVDDGLMKELPLKFILVGDMPYLLNIMGKPYIWSSDKYCLFCTASRRNADGLVQPRTLMSLMSDFRQEAQPFFPVLCVPTENICPSTLHLFLGIASYYFTQLENLANKVDEENQTSIFEDIQDVLSRFRISKGAWFQKFTGNQIKKMIGTPEILSEICGLFPSPLSSYSDFCYYVDLLLELGKIQQNATSKFLNSEEENLLLNSIQNFKEKLYNKHNPHIFPKLHWLLEHVGDFVAKHHFWGLSSEQGIENLHHTFNEDFSSIRDEEQLFRQICRLQSSRNFFYDTKP